MEEFKIVKNEKFGYYHLDPIPDEEFMAEFYKEKYYKEISRKESTRDARLQRLIDNNQKENEIQWLNSTYFKDICYNIQKFAQKGNDGISVIDIGCGTGELLKFMQEYGFKAVGIEPSIDAFEKSKDNELKVYNCNIEEFIKNEKEKKFDCVNMSNVLEHVLEPLKVIEKCKELLNEEGIIRIQVPNDFNELQEAAVSTLDLKKWWVCIPDHISYFNYDSLIKILEFYGFEVMCTTSDFPMELFLLMGDNYILNKNLGKECHEKRKLFEQSIPDDLRRKLYNSLSKIGLGRNLIIYGKRKK
ncbi:class I SAM-dependent methyltransferase [Oceanirhabdus sp. W0125-5]|uniref:class I SAM-dependent methyltransferase n=1 Tax=Oceanirhabdus sp. W0125-5 TaxID=2999116 RepID=UPI0022F30259|nr:class I SAM-dependent methyltransferase [Oceanirhabdus sp. W0125-5]WBW95450.1 class I SAM-dependent methyltransferase [Oceanirhabdus sp. W0125-5]